MCPEIKRSLRAGATVLALLVIAPDCSSSSQSGPNDGGGGTGGSIGSGGADGGRGGTGGSSGSGGADGGGGSSGSGGTDGGGGGTGGSSGSGGATDGGGGTGGSSGSGGATDGGGGTGGSSGSGGATGGTIGASCGADLGACPPGQGCLWECYGDSFHGQCVTLPTACDASLNPVCGCDGKSYGNECLLQQAVKRKDYDGECVFISTDPPGYDLPLPGVWSGPGIRMNVTATGATISFGCASGTIDQPLTLAPRSYTVAGPILRAGWWQGTLSGADGGDAPASVTYTADLSGAVLQLQVMDQSWSLQHQDAPAPSCP